MSELAALEAGLGAGKIAPVYLFYGNEPGPIRAALMAVRKAVLEDGLQDFNHERFGGRELEGIGVVLDACAQVPMMAAHRLVELDSPEAVGKGGGDAAKASLDALVRYIASPCASTVLVLCSAGIDGRSRLVTATKKTGVVVKFEHLRRDRDAVEFVHEQARVRGLTFGRGAADALVERVGTGQSDLLAALERVALHAGEGRAVGRDDVEAVAGHTRESVVFDLTDAVGMGHADRALAVLAGLFHESSIPEVGQANAVLAMLIRQFRLLAAAYACGGNPSRIAAVCGVPPFVARKLAEQSRGWSGSRLRGAYAALARLDRDLKGGAYSVSRAPYVALQRFVLESCGRLPHVARRV